MMSKRPRLRRPSTRRLGAATTALGLAAVNVAVLVTGWTQGWITLWWVALTALCAWLAVESCSALFTPDDPRPFAAMNAVGSRRWWTRGTEEYDMLAWGVTAVVCLTCAYGVYATALVGWRAQSAILLVVVLAVCGLTALLCLAVLAQARRLERRRAWAGLPPLTPASRGGSTGEPRSATPLGDAEPMTRAGMPPVFAVLEEPRIQPSTGPTHTEPLGRISPAGQGVLQGQETARGQGAARGQETAQGQALPSDETLPQARVTPSGGPALEDTVVVTPLLRARPPMSSSPGRHSGPVVDLNATRRGRRARR